MTGPHPNLKRSSTVSSLHWLTLKERTLLLVHLIRIRWGPEQWKQSNGETAPIPTFVRSEDWVQFLQESFPPERLAEVPGSSPEKTKQRIQYLKDIYKVVLAEQEHLQGGNGAQSMMKALNPGKG